MGNYCINIDDDAVNAIYRLAMIENTPVLRSVVVAPYTEPDLEQVREDAYQRGYCDALEKHCKICEEKHDAEETYQQGLNDAWECARKIGSNSMCSLKEMGFDFSQCVVRDYNPSWFVVKNYSAPETIEKILQYEQEKEEQIQVGDEVIRHYKSEFAEGDDAPSIFISEEYGHFRCLAFNGRSLMVVEYPKNQYRKTGRHFPEIAAVLEKIKEKE